MDPIRPIEPRERELEPVLRVERAGDREQREEQQRRRREREQRERELTAPELPQGTPERGDDGEQHIDVRV